MTWTQRQPHLLLCCRFRETQRTPLPSSSSSFPSAAAAEMAGVTALKAVFLILGCAMVATLIYTLSVDGSPFRKELLTPWMTATLIDFYINVAAISAWVIYKESSWISAFIWVALLICFGSITTCAYIVKELFKLSSQDPAYLILIRGNRTENRYEVASVLNKEGQCGEK